MKKFLFLTLLSLLLPTAVAFADSTIPFATSKTDGCGFGSPDDSYCAQPFTPSENATAVIPSLCVDRAVAPGAPTDNVVVSVEADSGGIPSGTPLASTNLPASAFADTSWYDGDFCSAPQEWPEITVSLTSGSTYWLVVSRSGSASGSNFWILETGVGGGLKYYESGSWHTTSSISAYGSVDIIGDSPPPTPSGGDDLGLLIGTKYFIFMLALFVPIIGFWWIKRTIFD